MKSIHGLTLIELMTGLAILAILSVIAIPSYQYLVTHNRIVTDTNRLLGSLLYARSEAAKRGLSVSICPSADPTASPPVCGSTWNNGWVVFEDVGKDGGFTAGTDTVLRREVAMRGGNKINNSSGFNNFIRYDPDGRSNNSDDEKFTICSEHKEPKYTRKLNVGPTGRPQVEQGGSCP